MHGLQHLHDVAVWAPIEVVDADDERELVALRTPLLHHFEENLLFSQPVGSEKAHYHGFE